MILPLPVRFGFVGFQDVNEELAQLIGAACYHFGLLPHRFVVFEQLRIMVLHHGSTGAGGNDDGTVRPLEKVDEVFRRFPGLTSIPAAVSRFAAAGLSARISHFHAEVPKQANGGLSRFRKDGVDETCAE